jgi:hypothetical protein
MDKYMALDDATYGLIALGTINGKQALSNKCNIVGRRLATYTTHHVAQRNIRPLGHLISRVEQEKIEIAMKTGFRHLAIIYYSRII